MDERQGRPAGGGQRLWQALLALAVAGLCLLAYLLWSVYRDVRIDAETTATNYAALVDARFNAVLDHLDADLGQLVQRLPQQNFASGRRDELNRSVLRELRELEDGFHEVATFRVVDSHGQFLGEEASEATRRIASLPFFAELKERTEPGTRFSELLRGPGDEGLGFVAARAIRDRNGRFLGAVLASIQLEQLKELFDAVRLGEGGTVTIRRSDTHALILSTGNVEPDMNQRLPAGHPLIARLAAGERQGTLNFVSQLDGVGRFYAFRRLPSFPYYVLVGIAEPHVMAEWRRRVATLGVLGMILISGLGVVLIRLFLSQQRELFAAAALQRQRLQLEAAQRIGQLGSWESGVGIEGVACSEIMRQIYELPAEPAVVTQADLLQRIHPDDRTLVRGAFDKALAGDGRFDVRHRLLMPDGRIKHLTVRGEIEFAADRSPRLVVGTTQDVTGQHQLEAQMQLLASAFHYSGEAILITNRDNEIVTVNPAFTRLTGYSEEEAIGRNPRFLSAGRTTEEAYRQMWSALNEKGFWQGEVWDRRKDGGIYPKWMSVSVIREADDGVLYHVAHFTDVTAEREAEAQLEHIAHHDMLTGLLNRLSLNGRLEQALAVARRVGGRVAVMFIDLDRFKIINDTLGHHIGDELLIAVAGRLRAAVRESDVVARLGGDEFVVMLTSVEHSASVAAVAEKLVRAIGEPYVIEGHDLYTTPSVGIALFPTDGGEAPTLMKNADAAMYHAKAAGRNTFQFFDAHMNDAALERLHIEHSLRRGLARDEFFLEYQPLIEMESGRVRGVEALVRWLHPERGIIPPDRFIGVAEETGLIQALGDLVFWAACRQLAVLNAAGYRGVRMGINISALQFRNGNLPVLAKGAIEAFGLDPSTLIFEITESVAMQQPDETIRILDLLHAMGVGLAIDDFGTGYSSLSYLRMFPIDHLKLDRTFVQEIDQGQGSEAICDATIALAHTLGLKAVAEGVETERQAAYLKEKGCDLAQGFLYSKPVSADALMLILSQRNT